MYLEEKEKKFIHIDRMTIRHPEKVNKPVNPLKKKPEWIRSKFTNTKEFFLTKTVINQNNLVTFCQEANCPNITLNLLRIRLEKTTGQHGIN